MSESNGKATTRPTYAIEPNTIAAIGGVGAVFGAFRAVLEGEDLVDILAAAAVAGLACAIVGVIVSLHRKETSDSSATVQAAPP